MDSKTSAFFEKYAEKSEKTYPLSRALTAHGPNAALGGLIGSLHGSVAGSNLGARHGLGRRMLAGALLGGGAGTGLGYLQSLLERRVEARAMRGRAATGYKSRLKDERKILKALREKK